MSYTKESVEQTCLFRWADYESGTYPELKLLLHIPNGGKRNRIEAANLKKQGVKAGVPDLFLPVARGKYNGLFIELKVGNNTPTELQKEWIERLNKQNYLAVVCYGWNNAADVILEYMQKPKHFSVEEAYQNIRCSICNDCIDEPCACPEDCDKQKELVDLFDKAFKG